MEILNDASAKIDMFGLKVGINFKGKSTVTTKLGALITLLTFGLSAGYLWTLISKLLHREDPKIN
jgi:hypothetical protein